MNTLAKPSLKTALAVMPYSNTLYICWFVWHLAKLGWMKFGDWVAGELSESTVLHQEYLDETQDVFSASLLSAGTFWFIFGPESPLNLTTLVIGKWIYFTAMNIWTVSSNYVV